MIKNKSLTKNIFRSWQKHAGIPRPEDHTPVMYEETKQLVVGSQADYLKRALKALSFLKQTRPYPNISEQIELCFDNVQHTIRILENEIQTVHK